MHRLVAFVDAKNGLFDALKTVVDLSHLLPSDTLPQARKVGAFLHPFCRRNRPANRQRSFVAEEWAVAYEETNRLIDHICRTISQELAPLGVSAAWELPTYKFDRVKLVARWAHKSLAYIAGSGGSGGIKCLSLALEALEGLAALSSMLVCLCCSKRISYARAALRQRVQSVPGTLPGWRVERFRPGQAKVLCAMFGG